MVKIDKRLVIPVVRDTVTERISDHLHESEKRGIQITENLRTFTIAGFQLQELGGGVIDSFLGMERNGELHGLSRQDRAKILINMLERVAGIVSDPVEISSEPEKPETEKEETEPVKKMSDIASLVADYSN